MLVFWSQDFDSGFVVRQQRTGSTAPAMITMEGVLATEGTAHVIFDSDGGSMNIQGLTAASLSALTLFASTNAASVIVSDASIQRSNLRSVTDARGGAFQRVEDVSVQFMEEIENVFICTDASTRLELNQVVVENNSPSVEWRIVNARGADVHVSETTVARNTDLQFAFTASSSDSTLTIEDSVVLENSGIGVSLNGCFTLYEEYGIHFSSPAQNLHSPYP